MVKGVLGGLVGPALVPVASPPDGVAAPEPWVVVPSGGLAVTGLRTDHLENPLGITSGVPSLSWWVTSDGHHQRQTHYRIQAAGSADGLEAGRDLLWDSGRTAAEGGVGIGYGGPSVVSRQRVHWRVMVWNGDLASPWSTPAFWETGLLSPGDWTAVWIGRGPSTSGTVAHAFAPVTARYVRLRVFETGPVPTADPVHRLQLMELRVRDGSGRDLAAGATVTGRDPFVLAPQWGPAQLVDGNPRTGFTTIAYPTARRPVDDPLWVQVDLGRATPGLSSVELVHRTDQPAADSTTPNHAKRYQVQTSEDGQGWTTVGYHLAGSGADGYEALGVPEVLPAPTITTDTAAPMFATRFDVAPREVARARLYVSGLGSVHAEVNGEPVTDSHLDPGESDYRRRILYATYDVTRLVRPGGNGLGFVLGTGMYGVGVTPNGGRYEKTDGLPLGAAGLAGRPTGIAQLEVTYTDGSRTTVASDDSWWCTDSAVTFTSWFGGEDFDARRAEQLAGWSTAANTFAGWTAARRTPGTERPAGILRGRATPPMRIVEVLQGSTGRFPSGDGWVDVSRNGAGFPGIGFRVDMPAAYAGVSLRLSPAEILTATDVDQSSTKAGSAPLYDTYTFSGRERAGTSWHPRFAYHGFRYYKVALGLPAGRTPAEYGFADRAAMLGELMARLTFVGNVVRTDNAVTGSFTSSDSSLNLIRTIIDRSIASQMYSTFTDCPHIEKLGWMETSHLMLPSIAGTYDVRAWMGKIVQDAVDSQVTGAADRATRNGGSLGEPGYATAIAPPFQIINGLNRDPNWNGAIILTAWEHYQAYGDPAILRAAYPAMRSHLGWLRARYAPTYLITDAQMGDWGQYGVSTPTPLVVTAAFHRMADVMARTATILGRTDDAAAHADLAAAIRATVNAAYFDPATGRYAGGTQASQAVALFSGLVPESHVGAVVAHLVAVTEGLGHTITTGEVALRQMISALTAHGRSDVLLRMALQPRQPGYRYIAETLGETTMIEYWNYRDQWGGMRSRNHAMLGHIQDWFSRGLAGIDRASAGYRTIVIRPFVPDDGSVTWAEATVGSSFGTIGSRWELTGSSLTMSVDLPVGTTATVHVPALGRPGTDVLASYGAAVDRPVSGLLVDGHVVIENVPSGRYRFTRDR